MTNLHGDMMESNICEYLVRVEESALSSTDVSQAFLPRLTFEQIEAMEGETHQEAQITLPPGSVSSPVSVLQQIRGCEDFDPMTEVLRMLRGRRRLKVAPRLLQKRLQLVLYRIGRKSLHAEPKLPVCRENNDIRLLMSSHVDDPKGSGDNEIRERMLKTLQDEVPKVEDSVLNIRT